MEICRLTIDQSFALLRESAGGLSSFHRLIYDLFAVSIQIARPSASPMLQMLNCCIRHRISRSATDNSPQRASAPSPSAAAVEDGSAPGNEDEEFFDAVDDNDAQDDDDADASNWPTQSAVSSSPLF